jgi:hypothetical protein
MKTYIAQEAHNLGDPLSPGEVGLNSSDPVSTLANLISTVIGLLTVIGALYFMFMIITGAIAIISSAGDQGKYEDARKRITTGAIGFVVVIAAMFIMSLIALILDIPNILDLGEMIEQIRLQ